MVDDQLPDEKKSSKEGEFLQLNITDENSGKIVFKVKKTALVSKLKRAYSERKGSRESSVRLFFGGQRLHDNDTLDKLGLQNGDTLEVVQEQQAGFI